MEVRELGPWAVSNWGDERIAIQSDDFHHDAALEVTGDFGGSVDAKREYADLICSRLNTIHTQPDFDVLAMRFCTSTSTHAKMRWVAIALSDPEQCERRIAHHSARGWLGKSGEFARALSRMVQAM